MEPPWHKRVTQDLIKKETGKKNYIKSLNEHNKAGTRLNFRAIFTTIISKQTNYWFGKIRIP